MPNLDPQKIREQIRTTQPIPTTVVGDVVAPITTPDTQNDDKEKPHPPVPQNGC